MSQFPDTLWINVSPSFQRFDRPLLNLLSQQGTIVEWQYRQTPDDPTAIDAALCLLHNYLNPCDRPLHLIGHGTSGLIAWLYACCHPERVRSLTLLSVGANPGLDWQAYYYEQLTQLPCTRSTALMRVTYSLFGYQSRDLALKLLQVLERDLLSSVSPHSLYRRISFCLERSDVPLLICGGAWDVVAHSALLDGWKPWLKTGDRLWRCPEGRYFFHYFYPDRVLAQIQDFRTECCDRQPIYAQS